MLLQPRILATLMLTAAVPVSQLAGFAKKEDLRFFTRSICHIEYIHSPSLAPTKEMLDAYKNQKGDWNLYEQRFLNQGAYATLADQDASDDTMTKSRAAKTPCIQSEAVPIC